MILGNRQRLVIHMTNKTGSASVKGQVVKQSASADENYEAAPGGGILAMGVVLVGGIPDGQRVPICIMGKCQVLFEVDEASTRGNWASMCRNTDGVAWSKYAAGGNTPAQGLGMTLESLTPAEGASVLVWVDFLPSKSKDVVAENVG